MPTLTPEMVAPLLATGASARVAHEAPARFQAGDAVVAHNRHPTHHTRLARYVRGKRGVVQIDHGVFAFNDSRAHGLGEQPQRLYNVRFTARELWGPQASAIDTICIDLFDSYLDPA